LDQRKIPAFLCPSDSPPQNILPWNNYAGCTGGNKGWWLNQTSQDGMFNQEVTTRVGSVNDGMSNTVFMSEIISAPNGGAPGTQQQLARVRYGSSLGATGGAQSVASGITVANVNTWGTAALAITNIAGGEVGRRWYHGELSRTVFNSLYTPNSKFPNVSFACDGCAFDQMGLHGSRSHHTGGVHALMGDGVVKFVSENVDWAIWNAAGSRNDGVTIGDF
jgi:hypothetical protein